MILVDFGGLLHQNVCAQDLVHPSEHELRHIILASLREINIKYRNEYGRMVICCDSHSWRYNVFAEYKAARPALKVDDGRDWGVIWKHTNKVLDEIREHLPWKVMLVDRAEADDIIGALCFNVRDEPIMIVSRDKDFIQLHVFKNVKQYDTVTKKFVGVDDPINYAFTHVFKGDRGDGIPNIYSDDDHLVKNEARQKSVRKTDIVEWMKTIHDPEKTFSGKMLEHYRRNYQLISLSATPDDIKAQIKEQFEEPPIPPNGTVLQYFMDKDVNFVDLVQDFN